MAGTTNMPDLRTRLTLDISDFTRGLVSARSQASLFGNEIQSVASHFKTAGVAMATFATVSLFTAGIIATSFMGAIAVLMTLGAVSAFQAQSVQDAWGKTGERLRKGMLESARSYVPVLERLAARTITVFDSVQPAITAVFDRLAPLFEDLSVSFLDWFAGLVNRLPQMVNNAIAFLFSIGPAWDQATDNMRLGMNAVYDAVINFGPALLQNGLPAFGAFVGGVIALLAPIIEASSQFAGPFFSMLAVLAEAGNRVLSDVLGQITPELIGVANAMAGMGLGLESLLSGIGVPLSALLTDLALVGDIAARTFASLGANQTLAGLLQAAADTGTELLPVLDAFGTFLVGLGPVAVALAKMVTAMVHGFVAGIQPLLDALDINWSGDLVEGIELITPAMERLAFVTGQFVTFLITGLGVVVNALAPVASAIGSITGLFEDTGFSAGKALVVGIIAGLGFMVSPLVGVVAGLVAAVAAFLPRSPAEVGPLSGDGAPDQRGFRLGEMFADGIAASAGLVRTAAGQLVTSVLPGLPTSIGAPGVAPLPLVAAGTDGGVQNIVVNVAGSVTTERDLITAIKESMLVREIRNAGSVFATEVRGN